MTVVNDLEGEVCGGFMLKNAFKDVVGQPKKFGMFVVFFLV